MDRVKRLDRLLKLRLRRERQASLQLALGLREDEERRRALLESEGQLEEARRIWQDELGGGLAAARLTLLRSYLDQRQRGLTQRERLVRDWQPRLGVLRVELGSAARERQALEHWRERLRIRLRLEESRAERRALDEIGLRENRRRNDPEHGED
ncbi:MAG: flagellar export protein FliJ [Candidatus Delongbacteria bacterium]